jgi:hypothetical protein
MLAITSRLHATVRPPKMIGGRTDALADVNAYGGRSGTLAPCVSQHGACGKVALEVPDGA